MRTKFILLSCAGIFFLGLAGIIFFRVGNYGAAAQAGTNMLSSVRSQSAQSMRVLEPNQKSAGASRAGLQTALAETDSTRRRELLRRWADSQEVAAIKDLLANLASMTSEESRADVRRALLASWSRRDLPGMADWFGTRSVADELHQDTRELLAQTLAAQEPQNGFSWMEKSLPEEVRQELYGAFFRQWAEGDPAGAAAKLRQLAEASPGTPVWNDLTGQVVAQWAATDLKSALAWTLSLPDGTDKLKVLAQLSDRWVQSDPNAAATYADTQNSPELLNAVVAKWAEFDARKAAAWTDSLLAGAERNGAIVNVAATWAQKDPKAAAEYVGQLSAEDAKAQASLAVASVWASADPAGAAKWIGQLPEGTVRELAMEQLLATWAGRNAGAAGDWLKNLPASRSRDVAVSAYCAILEPADPVASFEWAKTISDVTIREQRIESAATVWMEKHPDGGVKN